MVTGKERQAIVDRYFQHLAAIQGGDESAVKDMLGLWHDDATCEFIGAGPLTGEFRGRDAVNVLFSNIARTPGVSVTLRTKKGEPVAIGPRKFKLGKTLDAGNKTVVHWESEVSTKDAHGFSLAGSNTFVFEDDKIRDLRIVFSPRAEAVSELNLSDLDVVDIGRLALAVWAVV